MRKTFFVITALAVLTPGASAPVDKSVEPKLLATGYALLRVANELNLVRTDMFEEVIDILQSHIMANP
jgi:hypothetical protein